MVNALVPSLLLPLPKVSAVLDKAGEPQTTYVTFRLLFRSNVQISNSPFQSIIFNKLLFLGNHAGV